ncbi:MAG TPA: EthD family reductase [Polyangiaceae bacterium]|jgi:uncharacterized protein (TIGR02118 family)
MYVSVISLESAGDIAALDESLTAWVRSLPAVRLALIGGLRDMAGGTPKQQRGALIGFEDGGLLRPLRDGALLPPVLRELGDAVRVESVEACVEVPLEPRAPGQRFFALLASFDYTPAAGDLESAERHYLSFHVPQSRKLPNLRGYLTGRMLAEGTRGTVRYRKGFEIFDNRDALAASFRSPEGEAVVKDGAFLCGNVSVHHFDAVVVT